MADEGTQHGISRGSMTIAAFSTVVEWYDFTLYLYLATLLSRVDEGGTTPREVGWRQRVCSERSRVECGEIEPRETKGCSSSLSSTWWREREQRGRRVRRRASGTFNRPAGRQERRT